MINLNKITEAILQNVERVARLVLEPIEIGEYPLQCILQFLNNNTPR